MYISFVNFLDQGGTTLQNVAESVQWQIRYLMANMTNKKTLKSCSDEIHHVKSLKNGLGTSAMWK